LILITSQFRTDRAGNSFTGGGAIVLRGATTILNYDGVDNSCWTFFQSAGGNSHIYKRDVQSIIYLDSPATTSSTTYKLQYRNYDSTGNAIFQENSAPSNITLLEIGV